MLKLYENFQIFHFQKKLVSAETIHESTVYDGFIRQNAGKLAIWPWLICQYSNNTFVDLPSSVVDFSQFNKYLIKWSAPSSLITKDILNQCETPYGVRFISWYPAQYLYLFLVLNNVLCSWNNEYASLPKMYLIT